MSIISLALTLLLFPSFAISGVIEGTVVKVADGDTITVLDSDKVQHRVRIAGIDAPEKNQPFGNASRKRLGELVARKDDASSSISLTATGASLGRCGLGRPTVPHAEKHWTWDSRRSRRAWRGGIGNMPMSSLGRTRAAMSSQSRKRTRRRRELHHILIGFYLLSPSAQTFFESRIQMTTFYFTPFVLEE
jgi:hypothetical protein